jgi:hypothetical protein
VVLIEGLADECLDDGLAADVQFQGGLIEFLQHGRGEVHVDALDRRHHPAPIREIARHVLAPVRHPGDGLG